MGKNHRPGGVLEEEVGFGATAPLLGMRNITQRRPDQKGGLPKSHEVERGGDFLITRP